MRQSGRPIRRDILQREGLEFAPAEVQEAFWRSYNTERRLNWRRPAKLGELAIGVVRDGPERSGGRLRSLCDAWAAVLRPEETAVSSVEHFVNGRLTVKVDSAATKFLLSRRAQGGLIDSLNRHLSGFRISRIEFRIGAPRR